MYCSPGWLSPNYLPHSLKHAYWIYKLVEKRWVWYSTHVKSPKPKRVQPRMRRESPFAYIGVREKKNISDGRDFSNFGTVRAAEDHDHSKWPEFAQNFKFLIKNYFCLTCAECCPIYCCPRPYSVGPGALSPTQILSPSFGMKFFYQKPMFLIVGQVIWRHSARANVLTSN